MVSPVRLDWPPQKELDEHQKIIIEKNKTKMN